MTNYPLRDQLQQLEIAERVGLIHTFDPDIPRFSEFEKGQVSTSLTIKEHGFYVQRWNTVTQYGTHIDASIRFVENKRYLEDLDLKELVLPLIVLDYSKEVKNNDDFIVTRQHLEQWEAENGRIEEGIFVALRTDRSKRWPGAEQFENKDTDGNQHLLGWELNALKSLIGERDAKSIGHEAFDTDMSVNTAKNGDIVGERYIFGQDTFQLGLLTNLDQLSTRGAVIYATSPKPKDAPGFPVCASAIKPS